MMDPKRLIEEEIRFDEYRLECIPLGRPSDRQAVMNHIAALRARL